jgi:hypothetical protein
MPGDATIREAQEACDCAGTPLAGRANPADWRRERDIAGSTSTRRLPRQSLAPQRPWFPDRTAHDRQPQIQGYTFQSG